MQVKPTRSYGDRRALPWVIRPLRYSEIPGKLFYLVYNPVTEEEHVYDTQETAVGVWNLLNAMER
jgi:hypothetical protein